MNHANPEKYLDFRGVQACVILSYYSFFAIFILMWMISTIDSLNLIFQLTLSSLIIPISSLVLIRVKKYNAGRISFLILSYLFIFALSMAFGKWALIELYLIPGMGVALLFFPGKGFRGYDLISFVGIPVFILLQFLYPIHPPLVKLSAENLEIIAYTNQVLAILTSIGMYAMYSYGTYLQMKKIKMQQEDLNRKNQKLKDFALIVAHDLKTPLGNSNLIIKALKDLKSDPNKEMVKLISLLETTNESMKGLISNVLDYSLAGEGVEGLQTINLKSLELELMKEFHGEFEFQIDSDLHEIEINKVQFEQIMGNLISNSIKYANVNPLKVRLEVVKKDEFYEFTYRDNGVGIDLSKNPDIMNLLNTGSQPRSFESTGIGFSIITKLVALNHGESKIIEAKNGFEFIFTWKAS